MRKLYLLFFAFFSFVAITAQTHNTKSHSPAIPYSNNSTYKIFSDSVHEAWVARYNDPDNGGDEGMAIALDRLGNIYVTGKTGNNYTTIKYNSSGSEVWVTILNGLHPRAIAVDSIGNVFVTGEGQTSSSSLDFFTVWYNASGIERWIRQYNGPGNGDDKPVGLVIDDSDNVFVTGSSLGSDNIIQFATIKYNALGEMKWVSRYNGEANDIAKDYSGNVYVTGETDGNYTTIKYNAFGQKLWDTHYSPPGGQDAASSIVVDKIGNIYVTGSVANPTGSYDYATIKYNSSGETKWVSRYDGPDNANDEASSIAVDDSGNVYVTGASSSQNTNYDYATIKYDSLGREKWVNRYDNNYGGDYAVAVAVDDSGNVFITGSCQRAEYTPPNYVTICYSASGLERWIAEYGDSYYYGNYANALVIDNFGDICVTGMSYNEGSGWDYATVKYKCGTVSRVSVKANAPSKFALSQNYPNPFNPSTTIRWQSAVGSMQTLKVYDVLGREVATLVNEYKEAGNYSVRFDASKLTSGIYFYSLESGSFKQVKKMMVLK